MSNANTVSDMPQISVVLADCGYLLSQVTKVIAYRSCGKIFIAITDDDGLMLKKHYQNGAGWPVEEVTCTPLTLRTCARG